MKNSDASNVGREVESENGEYNFEFEDGKSSLASCYKEHCIYLLPMLGWFFFSSLLSLYNKYVFGATHMAFPCPLLMTSVHFGMQFLFSYTLTRTYPEYLGGDQIDAMSWSTFLYIAVPCGLVTSLDVGLSNLSMVRISLTFYTMVKSSSPIFVVLSAFLFGIEKITPALILTVLIISCGELLTVMGEVDFDLIGFILVLAASVLSGMRWTVVQLQLQSLDPPLKSTFATMRILSPFMFFSMVLLSLSFEEPWTKFGANNHSGIQYFASLTDALWTLGLSLVGATLAICMITCEFYLIMKSSAVVLMIGGVLKELTTIIIGITVMGDRLNKINSLGCAVVFTGVLLYKISLQINKSEKVYDTVDVDSNGTAAMIEAARAMDDFDYDEADDVAGGEDQYQNDIASSPGQQQRDTLIDSNIEII